MLKKGFATLTLVLMCQALLLGCGENSVEKYARDTDINTENIGAEDSTEGDLSEKNTEDVSEVSETENIQTTVKENSKAVSQNVDEWIPSILENCNSEFVGNHALDEGFLYWYVEKFGEEALKPIADETEKTEQDTEVWYDTTGESIHVLWSDYENATGFQAYESDNTTYKDCRSDEETVFAFTGDVNLAENMNTVSYMDSCENGIFDCLSSELTDLMADADVLMINNEFPYSLRGTPIEGKAFTFRANPSRVSVLQELGVDIVSLANNHMCDYGDDAIYDTLTTLDDAGIPHVGAGKDLDEASKPYYFICNGRKISIVAASQIERSYNYTREATETTPGVLKTLNPAKFVKVIEEAKENSDYCIVFVHWGTEGQSDFESDQVELAKAFEQAGADAIIGGHTHCLQGFSYINDCPVIYSLGNFWFSSTENDGVNKKDTGIARVSIKDDGELEFSFVPCVQENLKTYLVTDNGEKQRIIEWMNSHSRGAKLDSEGILIKD